MAFLERKNSIDILTSNAAWFEEGVYRKFWATWKAFVIAFGACRLSKATIITEKRDFPRFMFVSQTAKKLFIITTARYPGVLGVDILLIKKNKATIWLFPGFLGDFDRFDLSN